jgi:hypothetical protein
MPYNVGEKGSYGCSGYPAVKDDGTVMGCHDTREKAQAQITAINISEAEKGYKKVKKYSISESAPGCNGFAVIDDDGEIDGCFTSRAEAEAYLEAERRDDANDVDDMDKAYEKPKKPKRYRTRRLKPTARVGTGDWAMVSTSTSITTKADQIVEGDFVMGRTSEGMVHGVVEHIMWEGGTLGTPGSEYAIESMPPENPAMSVRVYEEEDEGQWEPTAYSIGMMYQDAMKLETLEGHTMDDEDEEDYDMEAMSKAETFTPTDGMKAAARRALKWKEEGKATGAGTPVGWGRARDIVAGRSMSISVVRRMFSFFSRHEQASKGGKDFNNTSNPSNGRIMWDAWGGDAGFTWSRGIVNRMRDKALFSNFGKDYTTSESLTEMFKSVGVGSMVSWNSSGGTARGKVMRIIRNGRYNVPNTDVVVTGTPEDPAAVIRLYRDGEPTDIIVAHKVKTLRQS